MQIQSVKSIHRTLFRFRQLNLNCLNLNQECVCRSLLLCWELCGQPKIHNLGLLGGRAGEIGGRMAPQVLPTLREANSPPIHPDPPPTQPTSVGLPGLVNFSKTSPRSSLWNQGLFSGIGEEVLGGGGGW